MYAYVKDNTVVELHDTLPLSWQNISGLAALSQDELHKIGWFKVELDTHQLTEEEFVVDVHYVFANNLVKQVKNIQLKKDNSSFTELLWEGVRNKRDRLINGFEWRYNRHQREVRLGLTPTDDISKLDEYMQALADITKQPDPSNIQWPLI